MCMTLNDRETYTTKFVPLKKNKSILKSTFLAHLEIEIYKYSILCVVYAKMPLTIDLENDLEYDLG